MTASAITRRLRHLCPALAALAVLAAVLAPGPAAAQGSQGSSQQSALGGKELLLPPCVPDAARAATPQAGMIKFVMCPDHLTIESVAAPSDFTFYPEFSPDRRNYVVHVADDVSEVGFEALFRPKYLSMDSRLQPGFAYGIAGSKTTNSNTRSLERAVRYELSPGVTTVEIGANQWFKRYGPSQEERNKGGGLWWTGSDKLARSRYTLQLVWRSPDTTLAAPAELSPLRTADYDTDDDGLIEVSSLAQLDAVRWDADGDGYADHGGPLHEGFPNALLGMGCPSTGCVGYELTADLDFDTNASGGADSGDDWWNFGHGWVPIGADTDHFSGVFEGNGHVISNLFIDSDSVKQSQATGYYRTEPGTGGEAGGTAEMRSIHLGLFEELARGGVIRNVGLGNVSVTRSFACIRSRHPHAGAYGFRLPCEQGRVGGLVGVSAGTISRSWVTGAVSNTITESYRLGSERRGIMVGGLVGQAHSSSVISASFASADVSADDVLVYPSARMSGEPIWVGGLVGVNAGAIIASYATGNVGAGSGFNGRHVVGGLVGQNSGPITASYVAGTLSGGYTHPLVRGTAGGSRVSHSYWDASTAGISFSSARGAGYSSAALQAPTGYTGIYANWNVDIDGDGSADDPWDFGTAGDYPKLRGVGPASDQMQQQAATYSISAAASAVEGQSATLTVTLSEAAPAGGVQFAVTAGYSDDATATSSDVGAIASPVTVPEGDTTVEVLAPTADDALDESDETFTVTVTAVTSGWAPSTDGAGTATVTIVDDDTAGVTVTATNPVAVDEGATATYTLVLDTQPSESVTITARSSDTDAATVSPASHIFTTANWNVPATFTVTALADDDTEDESVAISHRISRAGPAYETVPLGTVAVAVTDTTAPPQQKEANDQADQQGAAALPGPVTALELSATAGSVTVSWQAPDSGIAPSRYIVHLRPEGGKAGSGNTKTPRAKKTRVTFKNLEAGRTYKVWVRAQDGAARGERVTDTITLPHQDAPPASQQQPAEEVDTNTVVNQPPTVASPLGDINGLEPGDTRQVSLSGVFDDGDGDPLAVTARSSATGVATLSVASDYTSLTVRAAGEGTATITVTASDGRDTVSDTFTVTVTAAGTEPQSPEPDAEDAEAEETDPLERYDANDDGKIDMPEYQTALADYLGGSLTIEDLMTVRAAYARDAR
ncbi:MAG: fibronectin type III domain-containing protein [Acidimicrobiaceae bacterium]|nr:fibronectin type III domain-containing protein [Acidimicrobiaceae bacterium]